MALLPLVQVPYILVQSVLFTCISYYLNNAHNSELFAAALHQQSCAPLLVPS
jgi:hypothetical protein